MQTAKNQKKRATFNSKLDNNDGTTLGSQTVFLQAIDKHSIVMNCLVAENLLLLSRIK
jgi:hypothetical protein